MLAKSCSVHRHLHGALLLLLQLLVVVSVFVLDGLPLLLRLNIGLNADESSLANGCLHLELLLVRLLDDLGLSAWLLFALWQHRLDDD